jgi:hypothetical protein
MHTAILEEVIDLGLPINLEERTAFYNKVLPQTGSHAGKFVTQFTGVIGCSLVGTEAILDKGALTPHVPLKRQEEAKGAAAEEDAAANKKAAEEEGRAQPGDEDLRRTWRGGHPPPEKSGSDFNLSGGVGQEEASGQILSPKVGALSAASPF